MTAVSEAEQSATGTAIHHNDWVAALGPAVDRLSAAADAHRWRTHSTAFSVTGAAGSDLRCAEDEELVLFFTGVLTNVSELQAGAAQSDAARVALRLVKKDGQRAFSALRGPFGVIAWNRHTGELTAARDHLGMQSLFYASAGTHGWLVSPSPDVLVSQPGVSRAPDAVALSEWIIGWYPVNDDSAYRDVKKVPPATAMTFKGPERTKVRYWNPYNSPPEWLADKDLEQFEPLLTRAVNRATLGRRPAIFLSGGVDSISVAVAAADLARRTGTLPPLALSLAFPDKASNEETIQKGVAQQLGMDQFIIPFASATGPKGLLAPALADGASWPQPMWNVWEPAYSTLARHASANGHTVILTGRGGDEWLTISPRLMADQIRRGDFLGAWRVLRSYHTANAAWTPGIANLAWMCAGRPLASAALDAVAPGAWHRRRRRRLWSELPAWVAPDPAVRRAMDERLDQWIKPARPVGGFYEQAGKQTVEHPAITHDMEEAQEFGRRHGVRHMHPYWDVDLLEMLRRVRPEALISDGRAKALVRPVLARRLPGLGLESRVKVSAGNVFMGIMGREGPAEWQRMGGVQTLARIGAVDAANIQSGAWQDGWRKRLGGSGRVWTLMTFESWLQHRV